LPYVTGVSWCDEQLTADGQVYRPASWNKVRNLFCVLYVAFTAADDVRGAESAGDLCSVVVEDSIPLEYDAVLIG